MVAALRGKGGALGEAEVEGVADVWLVGEAWVVMAAVVAVGTVELSRQQVGMAGMVAVAVMHGHCMSRTARRIAVAI